MRLAALTEQSISTLAELLPPMVRRAAAVDTAIATATATAKTNEPELSAWVEAATAKLAKLLSNLGDAEGGSGGASQEAFSLAAAAMLECVCSPCTRPIVLAPDCPQPHAASGTPARRVPFPGPTPCSLPYTRSPRPISLGPRSLPRRAAALTDMARRSHTQVRRGRAPTALCCQAQAGGGRQRRCRCRARTALRRQSEGPASIGRCGRRHPWHRCGRRGGEAADGVGGLGGGRAQVARAPGGGGCHAEGTCSPVGAPAPRLYSGH